ncbi:hypothetical protein HDU97_006367 [Phlyctochytrium planicorne]|nr:hypothetical protein HDU97_006367 [Phlyctochytrium planicorne]
MPTHVDMWQQQPLSATFHTSLLPQLNQAEANLVPGFHQPNELGWYASPSSFVVQMERALGAGGDSGRGFVVDSMDQQQRQQQQQHQHQHFIQQHQQIIGHHHQQANSPFSPFGSLPSSSSSKASSSPSSTPTTPLVYTTSSPLFWPQQQALPQQFMVPPPPMMQPVLEGFIQQQPLPGHPTTLQSHPTTSLSPPITPHHTSPHHQIHIPSTLPSHSVAPLPSSALSNTWSQDSLDSPTYLPGSASASVASTTGSVGSGSQSPPLIAQKADAKTKESKKVPGQPEKLGNFDCTWEGCGKRCTRRQDLDRHMVTHLRDKTHRCPECGMSFSRKDAMRRHLKMERCRNRKRNVPRQSKATMGQHSASGQGWSMTQFSVGEPVVLSHFEQNTTNQPLAIQHPHPQHQQVMATTLPQQTQQQQEFVSQQGMTSFHSTVPSSQIYAPYQSQSHIYPDQQNMIQIQQHPQQQFTPPFHPQHHPTLQHPQHQPLTAFTNPHQPNLAHQTAPLATQFWRPSPPVTVLSSSPLLPTRSNSFTPSTSPPSNVASPPNTPVYMYQQAPGRMLGMPLGVDHAGVQPTPGVSQMQHPGQQPVGGLVGAVNEQDSGNVNVEMKKDEIV